MDGLVKLSIRPWRGESRARRAPRTRRRVGTASLAICMTAHSHPTTPTRLNFGGHYGGLNYDGSLPRSFRGAKLHNHPQWPLRRPIRQGMRRAEYKDEHD
jgi:hypothetical protein